MQFAFAFFVVYIFIIMIMPYLLYNYAPFSLFLTYFANVDIIINILSIHFPDIYRRLYNEDYETFAQYVSFNTINLVALSGIFLHGLNSESKNKVKTFVSMLIMAIVTWTLPTDALPYMNKQIDKYMKQHHIHLDKKSYSDKKLLLIVLASLGFLVIEWILIHYLVE